MTSNKKTCLITGGAGFIGSEVSHLISNRYDRILALDNLHPQIHPSQQRPARLHPDAELVIGDITNATMWDNLLTNISPVDVIHLAAETGTGQSLTEATRHGMTNVVGTTAMLDAFARHSIVPRRFILSSSRAVYGEGDWIDESGKRYSPGQRTIEQLQAHQWDFAGASVLPSSAGLTSTAPISIYGSTKLAQEHLLASWSNSFGSELVTLRFQNVYGEGQSLYNSYTGILVLFCRIARSGQSIPLYEDGKMLRDFVHVSDVAEAVKLALESDTARNATLDIGTGEPTSIATIANHIATHYASLAPEVCHRYRFGDVRHAYTTIEHAKAELGWSPKVSIADGLRQLAIWVEKALAEGNLE